MPRPWVAGMTSRSRGWMTTVVHGDGGQTVPHGPPRAAAIERHLLSGLRAHKEQVGISGVFLDDVHRLIGREAR